MQGLEGLEILFKSSGIILEQKLNTVLGCYLCKHTSSSSFFLSACSGRILASTFCITSPNFFTRVGSIFSPKVGAALIFPQLVQLRLGRPARSRERKEVGRIRDESLLGLSEMVNKETLCEDNKEEVVIVR